MTTLAEEITRITNEGIESARQLIQEHGKDLVSQAMEKYRKAKENEKFSKTNVFGEAPGYLYGIIRKEKERKNITISSGNLSRNEKIELMKNWAEKGCWDWLEKNKEESMLLYSFFQQLDKDLQDIIKNESERFSFRYSSFCEMSFKIADEEEREKIKIKLIILTTLSFVTSDFINYRKIWEKMREDICLDILQKNYKGLNSGKLENMMRRYRRENKSDVDILDEDISADEEKNNYKGVSLRQEENVA